MKNVDKSFDRRSFIKKTSLVALGTGGLITTPLSSHANTISYDRGINIVGPKEGFSPQIGTLVSMMNWMRMVILWPLKDLSINDLDYIHDKDANSIGAMLLHLAAIERFYQIHTFEGKKWGDWNKEDRETWSIPSELGQKARETVNGHPLEFYLDTLKKVRQHTLQEFAKRDDDWLMTIDKDWSWGPTNNYCKWFHVCEHESNHHGQIKWIKGRLPSV